MKPYDNIAPHYTRWMNKPDRSHMITIESLILTDGDIYIGIHYSDTSMITITANHRYKLCANSKFYYTSLNREISEPDTLINKGLSKLVLVGNTIDSPEYALFGMPFTVTKENYETV